MMKLKNISILFLLLSIALLLRLLYLGNIFQSSDNAELAVKIIKNPGYLWMFDKYGALINLFVKIFTAFVSLVGIKITEFWWKTPVALLGASQVILTYFFLKYLKCTEKGALLGAAFISVLPIHVMQSRYLWGYEVFGVFFVTLAIWKLLEFFNNPTRKTGIKASIFISLYLISHGYIIPFLPCIIMTAFLFGSTEERNIFRRLKNGLVLLKKWKVWLYPLLTFPLYSNSLNHALRHSGTKYGIFLFDHLPGFICNTGIWLSRFILLNLIAGIILKHIRSKKTVLFIFCLFSYFASFIFGVPKGATVTRGYMLLGTYFGVLCMIVVLDELMKRLKKFNIILLVLVFFCFFITLWGTVESIFYRDRLYDPSRVRIERGGIPVDPGSKAGGYIIRKYISPSYQVLVLHRSVEPPNLFYYFGREQYAFYDLTIEETIKKFMEMKEKVDIVVCGKGQIQAVEKSDKFVNKIVLYSEGIPVMWLYTKSGIEITPIDTDVAELNKAFDKEYPKKVSFW